MESATYVFIGTLIIGFLSLRWFITPIPQAVPHEVSELREQLQSTRQSSTPRNNRRPVTDNMIEVVQAIAPQLTAGQIRYDLERTGSVEVTIDRYMETGSLPFPPGEQPQPHQTTDDSEQHNIPPSTVTMNLIEKYGLDVDQPGESDDKKDNKWGHTKQERTDILSKKRQEMILNARKRLASQLNNEI